MKFWCWIRKLVPRRFLGLRKATRHELTGFALRELPVGPPIKEEIKRRAQSQGSCSNHDAADRRACPACGVKTKVKILKYWCDPVTDIVTPADTIEQCDCGWTGPIVEHERPL